MSKTSLKNKFRQIRKTLKNTPLQLIKKPFLIVLLPFAAIDAIFNRLRKETTLVFLTETSISKILNRPGNYKTINSIVTINSFQDFHYYAQLRFKEDQDVEVYYEYELRKRFARGDFSFILLGENGLPVSFLFICTQIAFFAQVDITLNIPRQTFGIYDVYTYKSFRGKGYYKDLFYSSVKEMEKKGYKTIWLWLMAHNKTSVHVHHQLGLDCITKVISHRLYFGFVTKRIKPVNINLIDLFELYD